MHTKLLQVALASAVAASSQYGIAQPGVSTHIIDPTSIQKIATTLNHTSLVQLPEPVTAAVIGSDAVRMEFRDNVVILQPQKTGVSTNLTVWTARHQTVYEVLPASETALASPLGAVAPSVILETVAPPPPPPPDPTPEEAQSMRDSSHVPFLMTTRAIRAPHCRDSKTGVHVCVEEVGEDTYSYYVRLSAVNRTAHPYRIATPVVHHIMPTFGEKMALLSVNQQLTDGKFAKVQLYDAAPIASHGSSLRSQDLRPGQRVNWVMAIGKAEARPVAMYEFQLPADGDERVHAVVIF